MFELFDGTKIPLGFSVKLDKFSVEYYESHKMRPKSFKSMITVEEQSGKSYSKEIRVNHPLMINGLTVFQSSYGINEDSSSSVSDSAVVEIRINGASMDIPPVLTLIMAQGTEYDVPGFGDSLKVRLSEIHRDFKKVQSASGETNPAVKIDVIANGSSKWGVYAFKNYPGVNMPMAPDLPVIFNMLDIKKGTGGAEERGYYSVLGAVRDSGAGVMWLGAMIMIIGLFFAFYIRPRKIVVVEDGSGILIGASSKGETETLKTFIENTMKNTGEKI